MAARAIGKCRIFLNAVTERSINRSGKFIPWKAINKPLLVSPMLKEFAEDSTELSRRQAVKIIWDYIKLHNLQNPSNKREIICDTKLKTLFNGTDTVTFTEIPGLLSPHFIKAA